MIFKTALVAALLQALPAFAVVHEQLAAVPAGWSATSKADTSAIVSFTIALTQENIDQLESKLLSVSTPGSAAYGQHLDVDELEALFPATAGASEAVESWLKGYVSNSGSSHRIVASLTLHSAGVSQISISGAYITFATTVGTANSLLNTSFLNFENAGVSKIRTKQYSIPSSLTSYIDLIDPTVFLGKTVPAV